MLKWVTAQEGLEEPKQLWHIIDYIKVLSHLTRCVKNCCTIFRSDRNMNGPYANFSVLRRSSLYLVLTCCHTTTRELNLKYFYLGSRKYAFKGLDKVFLCCTLVVIVIVDICFYHDRQNNKLIETQIWTPGQWLSLQYSKFDMEADIFTIDIYIISCPCKIRLWGKEEGGGGGSHSNGAGR